MNTVRRPSRLLGSLAAMLLVAGLAACGDDDSSTTTTTEATGGSSQELTISDVWARAVEDLDATDRSAVYMVIEGGSEDDALLSASVPADIAAVTEVHETTTAEDTDTTMGSESDMDSEGDMGSDGDMGSEGGTDTTMGSDGDMDSGDMDSDDMGSEGEMNGGMMQMREVDRIDIPAGETVMLEPGGFHVMLLEVQAPLMPGDTFDVTLTFELAGEQVVTAEVREP